MTKASLAEKPLKYVQADNEKYLSIGFNLKADHLTLKQQGVDAEKLPPVERLIQICQNKIVDYTTNDTRQIQFHVIFEDTKHVITLTYLAKRKQTQLQFKKNKSTVKGYDSTSLHLLLTTSV